MKKEYKTFNEKEKDILNEISDKDIIYEETQCGPQEQPIVTEQHLSIDRKRKNIK